MTAQLFGQAAPPGIPPEVFGPTTSVVFGGVGTLLVVLGVMARWPQVLRLGALQRAGQEQAPPAELPTDQPIR
jgi:hypothetical protein